MKKSVKNFLLLILLALLTVCTYRIMTLWSSSFSLKHLYHYLSDASVIWMLFAAVCAFGFIWFEAAALRCTCTFLGHGFGSGKAIVFSASDIYFSAITPSAAGGQPAALLMMMNRGIPAAVSTIALLLNLVMYTVSIMIVSLICFAFNPQLLLGLDSGAQVFIYIGAAIQIGFIILFVMCIFNHSLVMKVSRFGLRLCCRLRIIKDFDSHMEKLENTIDQYRECGILLRREKRLLVKVFFLNLMQRLSVIMVAVCVFMAVGGAPSKCFTAFSAQTFAVLGSNAMPVPGAVGIVDYIFINGFTGLVPDPVSLGMISRGLSFYSTFVFCGILMLIDFIRRKINNRDDKDAD